MGGGGSQFLGQRNPKILNSALFIIKKNPFTESPTIADGKGQGEEKKEEEEEEEGEGRVEEEEERGGGGEGGGRGGVGRESH